MRAKEKNTYLPTHQKKNFWHPQKKCRGKKVQKIHKDTRMVCVCEIKKVE